MAYNQPSHAIAKRPPFPHQSIFELAAEYNIPDLPQELNKYLIGKANPNITSCQLAQLVHDNPLPLHWQTLAVWTRVSVALPVVGVPDPAGTVERRDEHSEDSNQEVSLEGLRAVQLRLIFAASQDIHRKHSSSQTDQPLASKLLAYVEWFSAPQREATVAMDMYEVKRVINNATKRKQGGIIPLEWIVQPCPLVPWFPKDLSQLNFDENTCLDKHDKFFINSFNDQATYHTVF
ncbi:hypothetical protein K439DRAFT_1622307 [Ramaria rubella]|nr:hypothetical protein K439DRAFT_1622307 [Ramaria rubella]